MLFCRSRVDLISKMLVVVTAFVLPLSVFLTNVFFILVPILSLVSGGVREKLNVIFRNPVAIAMLAFFSLFIIGLSYTIAPINDALKMLVHYDKIFFAALLFPLFTEDKWRKYSINAFIIGSIVLLILSYLKYFGLSIGPHDESLKGHINFGFIMALLSYFLMLKIFAAKDIRYKIALTLILLLVVFNSLFLSIGRAGYFVFIGLFCLLLFQVFRWRGLLVAVIASILLFSCAYSFSGVFKQRIHDVANDIKVYNLNKNEDTSIGDRINFVRNSLKLIKERPIFGYGTGGYRFAYANIKPTPAVSSHNSHDEYLHIGVQFGSVGILMLLMLFFTQLWQSKNLPKDYCYIAQAIVVSIMIGSLANSWLLDSAEGHVYAYFIALAFAARYSGKLHGSSS